MSVLIRENRDNYWMLNWLDKFMEGHKGFICGGCFKNIFNQEKVKDLDIFFQNEGDREEAVDYFDSMTAGYTDGTMEDTVSEDEAEYRFLYENDNVKAYVHKETGIRLELISKIYGTAEQIISQFDFSITKFAYYKAEVECTYSNDTFNINEIVDKTFATFYPTVLIELENQNPKGN